MKTVDEIEAIADALTPSMSHVLMRCSDAGFWGPEETGCFREWRDVVAHRRSASFRGSVAALERRGLVVVKRVDGLSSAIVAINREGLRTQAALRLRGFNERSFER